MKSKTCFSKKNGSALTEYRTESEAIEGAKYSNSAYGNDLTHYQCSKCKKWHLTPKNRQTPSKTCYFCTDSNGRNKDLYLSYESAQNRANIIRQEQGIILSIYDCPYEDGYHLTKG